jgi:competence protein ComEC
LAPVALGCWAAALTTLHTGLRVGLVLAGLAVILGGAALALPRWRFIAASVLAGVACGAGVTSAHLAVRDAPELADLVRDRVTATVELSVRDDPRLVARQSWLVDADLRQVIGHFRVSARVLVIASDPGWRSLLPGQEVEATVRFGPSRGGDLNAAVLSASGAPVPVGRPPWLQRVAGGLRAGLQTAAEPLDDRPGGLLPGLVVGDTSRLDPALEQQFRDTGMTHLCAVSGHIVA